MLPEELPIWHTQLDAIAKGASNNAKHYQAIADEAKKQKVALSTICQLPDNDRNKEILTKNLYRQQLKLQKMIEDLADCVEVI